MDIQSFEQDLKTLVFRVGQEHYGIRINQVVSIERMQNITPYPNRPPYVLGVTTVREAVIPVVDLRSALTGESYQHGDSSRIIIVLVYGNPIGLLVDAATDVLDIPADIIQTPNLLETREVTYLRGIAKQEERLLILLDIEKLLEDTTNLDDLKEIKNSL